LTAAAATGFLPATASSSIAQLGERPFPGYPDHPAIEYSTRPVDDSVARLKRALESGTVRLKSDTPLVLLRSILDALDVPIESQMAVFSKSSGQARLIAPGNPRTLFFNDSVAIGWVAGGFIELAAQDARQGTIFYVVDPGSGNGPSIRRQNSCLQCHIALDTEDVPGLILRSITTAPTGGLMPQLGNYSTDQTSPLEERWGGWYVTGHAPAAAHLGNATTAATGADATTFAAGARTRSSLEREFDTGAYLSPYSDIVALMVFEHQTRMLNLITRIGWQARIGGRRSAGDVRVDLETLARDLVDYLLFVNEAPLPGPIRGTSGFADRFVARGPRDRHGRSLRDLDLDRRLMRYPCSYLVYSDAFDALPADALNAIYSRLWRILSGTERDPRYTRLSAADRRAILEILRETKRGLPAYFNGA
jgi:hypothetical protein